MHFLLCADSMGIFCRIYLKWKNLLKTIHRNENIHFKSIPLVVLFRLMWLHGLVIPKVITLLPLSPVLQPPNTESLSLWANYASLFSLSSLGEEMGPKGIRESTFQTQSGHHRCVWACTTSSQSKSRHLLRDQKVLWVENGTAWSPQWGGNSKVMKGK